MTDYKKEQAIRDAHARRRSAKELDEAMRKERLQERFWNRVYLFCMTAFCLIIAWTVLKIFL